MSYDVVNEFNREAIRRVVDISDMIEDERSKENSDESKITRLLFEQMLRGYTLDRKDTIIHNVKKILNSINVKR